MDKNDILSRIADTGYNVGFGAKKHFATYDIVEKAPGWIGFVSMGVGIFALFVDVLATKDISAILIVLGISGLLINTYSAEKQNYEQKAVMLTGLYNKLKTLYFTVKTSEKDDYSEEIAEIEEIETEFYSNSISKQILLSDWYAHYKFFWQFQIDWVDEQKHFRFFRDKVPLTLSILCAVFIIILVCAIVYYAYTKHA